MPSATNGMCLFVGEEIHSAVHSSDITQPCIQDYPTSAHTDFFIFLFLRFTSLVSRQHVQISVFYFARSHSLLVCAVDENMSL